MKTAGLLIVILILIFACNPTTEKPEIVFEDGVEIVLNQMEPYKTVSKRSSIRLEERFTIDTEKNEIAEIGLTDINAFDIDSNGNIYFFQGKRHLVYKFDNNGQFLFSFAKRGQGPGEIDSPLFLRITSQNEIPIQDQNKNKLSIFNQDGNLKKELSLISNDWGLFVFCPLNNGNFLKFRDFFDPESKHRFDVLDLYNPDFKMLIELEKCDYGQMVGRSQRKKKGSPRIFISEVTNEHILVGHENRGYEILVFDLNGKLLRKIRKEYSPVNLTEEFKETMINNFGGIENRIIIPDHMPPFHYFFLDDEEYLFVKAYERGPNKNEYIHDVFSPEGVLVSRVNLPGFGSSMYPGRELNRAKIKNQIYYCIREKENGYKELVVSGIEWE